MADTPLPPCDPISYGAEITEDIQRKTVSASIQGTYGLRKSIRFETMSGSINVRIVPLKMPWEQPASL